MAVTVATQEFMTRFRCLGAECCDTCCQGWNMQLGDETYALYSRHAPELLESVSGAPGQYIMRRDPKTDYCVKFSDGLCGIQKQYGEHFLGDACFFYPRVTRALGKSVTMTAALSCPEIARLALFDDKALVAASRDVPSVPADVKNYLPDALTADCALAIHRAFLDMCTDSRVSAERLLMRILIASESLERINTGAWPDAVPFYLAHSDSGLLPPDSRDTDQVYILQALCGLVVAAKKVHNKRLMQAIADMERALHVSIRMDTLAIAPLPDSENALRELLRRWESEFSMVYAPVLRRYLFMQLALALFPFSGFGNTLSERAAIIGVRMATVKLALMSACVVSPGPLSEVEVIRVIQSISRFLDHLAEPDFSLKIYQETGWLKKARLRALLGDKD